MKTRYLLAVTGMTLLAAEAGAQPVPQGDPNGAYCREFTQNVTIGGVPHKSYGTSCRQPDGSWKIVSSDMQQPDPNSGQPRVQYVGQPAYVSQPTYVADPYAYSYGYAPYPYQPYPYYYGGYAGPAIGVDIGWGHGWYHRGGYWHGGYGWRR